MKKIFLLSCVSKKLSSKAKASELYISTLFKLCLSYAKLQKPDAVYILSAKHGLLTLNDEIEPYDVTLNNMKVKEIKNWAESTIKRLSEVADLKTDLFVFLAGKNYRKFLIPHLSNFQVPMEGLPIGKQLQYLKQKVQMKEAKMDNALEWRLIWKEMQNNLINQPRCPDHPEYPHVTSLAQGVINDILEVDEKGVRVRSHRSYNEDFIDAEQLEDT